MKVAMIQPVLIMGEVSKNYQIIKTALATAMLDRPDVIVLPELWNTSFFPDNVADLADSDGRETKQFLSNFASDNQVNIVGGSIARQSQGQCYNTSYVFNRQGNLVACYDKVHLFSPSGEGDAFTAGQKLVTFELDGLTCGVVTCYDIRFPEWVRLYALADVQVLFVPAAWPEVRIMHWDTLNRARAIENQFFVVAVNALGHSDQQGNRFGGHSAIIDPWGEYISSPDNNVGVKTAVLDLDIIQEIRHDINVFRDRRRDLYQIKD